MPEQPLSKPTHFGLTGEQLVRILSKCLKPEEINGTPETQHERIAELIHWFARYADGVANPKWAVSHAFELAYYIATHAVNQHLDTATIRKDAYIQGLVSSETDRHFAKKYGSVTPVAEEDLPNRIIALEQQVAMLTQILIPTPG
jgi:hypothetical protein